MKNSKYLCMIFLFWSCSTYHDNYEIAAHQASFLTQETNLPILNIVVDNVDFEDMLNQPKTEIEIDGLFNLYREGVLIIDNESIELERSKRSFSTKFPLKSLG